MNELRTFLDAAWPRHDREAAGLADELHAMAPTLTDDDDGAEAVRLARHTMLGHRADAGALRAFLAALPAGEKLDLHKARAAHALAMLEGRPAEPMPEAVAWGLLGDVAQAEIIRGDLAAARARVLGIEAQAAAHADEGARRAYAATAYNLVNTLRTGPRSPAHDTLMIEMAELERRAWSRAGTWMHVERADYHLALCHALLGQGAPAMAYAAACRAACEANGADAAERFFAHECSVHAARAAGDAAAAADHRARMVALLAEVDDAGMKAFCEETLAATPDQP